MAVINVPTGFSVAKQTWEQMRMDIEFRSMFGAQAVEGSAPLWSTTTRMEKLRVPRVR